MVVGAALIEMHVHGSQSLKAKRGVVRSIVGRVRNRFNVAVAEVGGQGTWQSVQLGLSAAGSDPTVVRSELRKAIDYVEGLGLAEVLQSDLELLTMPHEAPLELDGSDEFEWKRDEGEE